MEQRDVAGVDAFEDGRLAAVLVAHIVAEVGAEGVDGDVAVGVGGGSLEAADEAGGEDAVLQRLVLGALLAGGIWRKPLAIAISSNHPCLPQYHQEYHHG